MFTEVVPSLCSWSDQKPPLPTGDKAGDPRAAGETVSITLPGSAHIILFDQAFE